MRGHNHLSGLFGSELAGTSDRRVAASNFASFARRGLGAAARGGAIVSESASPRGTVRVLCLNAARELAPAMARGPILGVTWVPARSRRSRFCGFPARSDRCSSLASASSAMEPRVANESGKALIPVTESAV